MKRKRILGGDLSLNLEPIQYEYAFTMYTNCKKNFWIPDEISIAEDISVFKFDLTEVEKHIFTHVFAQLSTMDSLATSVVGQLSNQVSSPEHTMALSAQAFQEAIHTESYKYCADHIGLDSNWLWSRWEYVPQIKAKIDYATEMHETGSLIHEYFFLAGVFENIWFLGGFNPIFAMARMGKLRRVTEVLQYIARDEVGHVGFGLTTVRDIIKESNYKIADLQADFSAMINTSIKLEEDYAKFLFSKGGYMGYSLVQHMEHITYLAHNTMKRVGMGVNLIKSNYTPIELPWIYEMLYAKKLKNFFEGRVLEYQPLQWNNEDLNSIDQVTKWKGNEPMNTEPQGAVCEMKLGCDVCQ